MRTLHLPRRGVILVSAAACLLLGNGGLALAVTASESPAPDDNKVAICHATDSDENPYVLEEPAKDGDASGHADHTGPLWAAGLKAAHIAWGDIIPPFDYTDANNATAHFAGLNWPAGQAILANSCNLVTPPTPTPTPTPTITVSPTPDVTVTPTPTITATPTPDVTVTPTPDVTATATPSGNGGGTIVVPSDTPSPSESPFTGGGGTVTLPFTGVPTELLVSVAAGLLALGVWLTYAGRRRSA